MKCQYCHNEFEAKRKTAKFCSDACRRDYNRTKTHWTKEHVETDGSPERDAELIAQLESTELCPSPFQVDIDYWTDRNRKGLPTSFVKTRSATCVLCGAKYQTQLKMMRFCTTSCLKEFHRRITGGL